MKQYIVLSLLVGACSVALFSLFGDDSYSRMQSLRKSIVLQQEKNLELETRVSELQKQIDSMRFDDRQLERNAREELGLARPNELIFKFDESLEDQARKLKGGESIKPPPGSTGTESVIAVDRIPAEAPSREIQGKRVLKNISDNGGKHER